MFGGMRSERGAECVSDMRFDAWLAGELSAQGKAKMSAHVAGCARCRQRQAALVAARQRFEATPLAEVPAWLMPARAPRAKARLLGGMAGGMAALACAAALLFMLWPAPAPETARVKGGEHVSFFVKRGERVQRGARAQRVQPGDKLRFTYTALAPRYLAILSVDATHEVSVYYPAGERAARVEPGVDVALPHAVELDAVLGEERVFALFCGAQLELAPLREQLARAPHALRAPPGCSLDEVTLTKEAPTP